MTILRYYPLSANTFHLILCHTFRFTVHSYRHHYYYYYFKSTQIHLSSRKSKIIFDPPSYILLSHAKSLSHGKRFVRIFLSFIFLYRKRTKYPNRSPQTITRNITKKTCSTNDVDSSRCSPSPSSCPRSIIPHFLVGPSQIRGSVVQEIAWP